MKFLLSGEIYADTGIAEFNIALIDIFMKYFESKSYSPELEEIFLIFVCRPFGPFTQRRRYDPVKRVFMVDVMLDFEFVMSANSAEKKKHYFESFNQVYPILERYKKKIKGLKLEKFKKDLDALLAQFKAAS